MFFYLSLLLVIVAAVTLVIGLLSSGLPLVIVSIVASFAAGVFLIVTVMRDRPQAEPAAVAPPPPPPAPEGPEAEEEYEVVGEGEEFFPIADYDDLRVSEIVPLLAELDDDELDMVREREESGKARTTILSRIDELLEEELVEEEYEEEEWEEGEEVFPIADYDDLRVNEIVPLLSELDDDELEDVREREESGKARSTILGAIDEMLGVEPPPPPSAKKKAPARKTAAKAGGAKRSSGAKKKAFPIAGYDDLNVPAVTKKLTRLDDDELKQVRTYEKRNKSRKGVLDAIDSELAAR